jgi:hypothetical protein
MLDIVTAAFNEWSNRDIMTHAASISSIATRNDNWGPSNNWDNAESTSNAELASAPLSEVRSTVSTRSFYASREHFHKLEEIGMTGMLKRHQLRPTDVSPIIVAWLGEVVSGVYAFCVTLGTRR